MSGTVETQCTADELAYLRDCLRQAEAKRTGQARRRARGRTMAWSVVRWHEPSEGTDKHTVEWSDTRKDTVGWNDPPKEDAGRVVRRFKARFIDPDGDGWKHYESEREVRDRAQALADALNHRGIGRERALRRG